MSELKTLKDITGIYSNGNSKLGTLHRNDTELKQEAIKWIKYYKKEQFPLIYPQVENPDEDNFWAFEYKIIWIKKFFNITDEDLK